MNHQLFGSYRTIPLDVSGWLISKVPWMDAPSSCVTVLHQSSFKLSNCSARKSISVLTDGNNPRREAKTA